MNFFTRWRLRKPAPDADSVYVTERSGVRSLHIGSDTIQSSMRLARPNDLELAYTRSMMAFLLFNGSPRRVLMVGLGGGSLAKFVYRRLPEAVTEVLEISPQVVAVARRLFELPAADARLIVRVCDAAEFVAAEGTGYDAILVDGYDGESQVPELASPAFYGACRRRSRATSSCSRSGILRLPCGGTSWNARPVIWRRATRSNSASSCVGCAG